MYRYMYKLFLFLFEASRFLKKRKAITANITKYKDHNLPEF
ncbi:hypothetical protein BC659_1202 [Sediminibacterium goheungense]|uniref:Uncharacterized protein n=1 Tax=Sediminibacterium goheungense TaxID=1086393 RepID=A0A4R6J1J1_9BACT|nr:hypothetical protein BC659_1202 [Sediminibacterium goheungense]